MTRTPRGRGRLRWTPRPRSELQCRINAATASAAGNNLTLNLEIGFKTGFSGAKAVFGEALDNAGTSTGYQALGTWQVP